MTETNIDRAKLNETDSEAEALTGIRPFENYPETITCPCCGKKYKPKYPTKEASPESTIWREQHLSGICSNKCWNKWFSPGDR